MSPDAYVLKRLFARHYIYTSHLQQYYTFFANHFTNSDRFLSAARQGK